MDEFKPLIDAFFDNRVPNNAPLPFADLPKKVQKLEPANQNIFDQIYARYEETFAEIVHFKQCKPDCFNGQGSEDYFAHFLHDRNPYGYLPFLTQPWARYLFDKFKTCSK